MLELETIVSFVNANMSFAYAILFLAMVAEGETFLIVAGVLAHLGALSLSYVMGTAFVGVMVGDVLWYYLGFFLKRDELPNFIKKFLVTIETIVDKLLPHFKARPILSLILAKFIYGTNHATLIFSGLIKMPMKLFIKAELMASFIWVPLISLLGYFFGYAAIQISHRVSIFLFIILLLIVGFIAIQRFISFYYENSKNKI